MFAIFEKPKAIPIEVLDSPNSEIIDIASEDADPPIARSNSQRSLDALTTPPTGTSQDDPIIVECSPVKTATSSAGPMWSIFQHKTTQISSFSKGKQKATEGFPAPFPESTSQHIRGPQSYFRPHTMSFTRRTRTHQPDTGMPDYSGRSLGDILRHHTLDQPTVFRDPIPAAYSKIDDEYIQTIPRLHQRYPAVLRSLRVNDSLGSHSSTSQEAWTEKWRPRRADEVVGNEERALYLRDWLAALRLQMVTGADEAKARGKKSKKRRSRRNEKPEVVRHVRKKRRMDNGLTDFLASDDDEELPMDLATGADDDDFEFCQGVQEQLGYSNPATPDASQYSSALSELEDDPAGVSSSLPFAYSPPNFGSRIHNTILLAGPSGCGKTAAVYACAEELGWEVFEVYPGIGERSGPEINKLIGDVGKNHIVHSSMRHSPVRQRGYFPRQGNQGKISVIRIDSEEEEEEEASTAGDFSSRGRVVHFSRRANDQTVFASHRGSRRAL